MGCDRLGRGLFYFFSFRNSAFSYINSKVLFAIKCREKYVIIVLILGD